MPANGALAGHRLAGAVPRVANPEQRHGSVVAALACCISGLAFSCSESELHHLEIGMQSCSTLLRAKQNNVCENILTTINVSLFLSILFQTIDCYSKEHFLVVFELELGSEGRLKSGKQRSIPSQTLGFEQFSVSLIIICPIYENVSNTKKDKNKVQNLIIVILVSPLQCNLQYFVFSFYHLLLTSNLLFSHQFAVQFMLLKNRHHLNSAKAKCVVTTTLILFQHQHDSGFFFY